MFKSSLRRSQRNAKVYASHHGVPAKPYKLSQKNKAAYLRAQGHSVRTTAVLANLSPSTVQALSPEELNSARGRILSQETRNAEKSAILLDQKMESAPVAVLNAIHGVAVDKLLALSGEPQMTVRHEHLHVTLTDEDLIEAALARKAERLKVRPRLNEQLQP